MKHLLKNFFTFHFLILFVVVSKNQSLSNVNEDKDKQRNHVILISIDGLAAFHLENGKLVLPNIRELIDKGVWPEASQTVFPSVTWPSHATLITGVSPRKHGVINNQMTNRETGVSFHAGTLSRKDAIHSRTLFDAAHEKELTTAAFCWPSTLQDTSIDFNLLCEGKIQVDSGLIQSLLKAGIPINSYYEWNQDGKMMQVCRDIILAKSAAEIIRTQKPHLIAIHFLVTDAMQHSWGPDHYISQAALTYADYNIGIIRQAVRDAGLEDRTTFVIVADHGFHSVYHEVNIYPVLKANGLQHKVRLHPGRWDVFVEKTNEFEHERDQPALEKFFEEVLKIEGLKQIIPNEDFHSLGYPQYEESPYVLGQYIIIPDIDTKLEVDTSYVSTERHLRKTPYHHHGYLPDHPRMYPAMVLSGYRIKKGQRIGILVRNHDVAPTIAEILSLDMPGVEGVVLWEALEK